jgi:hypothetical protein
MTIGLQPVGEEQVKYQQELRNNSATAKGQGTPRHDLHFAYEHFLLDLARRSGQLLGLGV